MEIHIRHGDHIALFYHFGKAMDKCERTSLLQHTFCGIVYVWIWMNSKCCWNKKNSEFYIHVSMHRNSILIRFNKTQQYAGVYLLQNYSICFGCPSHPSSGVHKTVNAASGIGHSIWGTTFLQRGLIRPCRRKVAAQILWPWPEAAVTVLYTPDDGCDEHPKHLEWFCRK